MCEMGDCDEGVLVQLSLENEPEDPDKIFATFEDILNFFKIGEASLSTLSAGAERFNSLLWASENEQKNKKIVENSDDFYKIIVKYATEEENQEAKTKIAKLIAEAVGAAAQQDQDLCATLSDKAFQSCQEIINSGVEISEGCSDCLSSLCETVPIEEVSNLSSPDAIPVICNILFNTSSQYSDTIRDVCKRKFESICCKHKHLLSGHSDMIFELISSEDEKCSQLAPVVFHESLYDVLEPSDFASNIEVSKKIPFEATCNLISKISESHPLWVTEVIGYVKDGALANDDLAVCAFEIIDRTTLSDPQGVKDILPELFEKGKSVEGCNIKLASIIGKVGENLAEVADEMLQLLVKLLEPDICTTASSKIILEIEKLTKCGASRDMVMEHLEEIRNFASTATEAFENIEQFAHEKCEGKKVTDSPTEEPPPSETVSDQISPLGGESDSNGTPPMDSNNTPLGDDAPPGHLTNDTTIDASKADEAVDTTVNEVLVNQMTNVSLTDTKPSDKPVDEVDDLRTTVSKLKKQIVSLEGELKKSKKSSVCCVM
eukprot:GHVL01004596.1.p1 GENE.GHVL01004596.1~~GHVL01004596.1.p1  ORF type:complete len:547 (+),score=158.80 GHVL01004596.1:27-1667(+)